MAPKSYFDTFDKLSAALRSAQRLWFDLLALILVLQLTNQGTSIERDFSKLLAPKSHKGDFK